MKQLAALAPNKRGSHLSVSLERLAALCGDRLLRVGLSATQTPIELVARFLGRPDAGSLARINADDVERLVVAVLDRELSRPELLADGPSAGWSAETRTLVRDTVERVVIQSGQVQITRRPAATSAAGDPPDEDGDPRQVHVEPLPAPRPRARKEIIVPGGRDSPPRRLNQALILVDLREHLTPQRSNGLKSMVARIRAEAETALAGVA